MWLVNPAKPGELAEAHAFLLDKKYLFGVMTWEKVIVYRVLWA